MRSKLKILHLEDLPSDAELVERALRKGNIVFEKLLVDTRMEYKNALTEFSPDIILSDHSLPSFNSIEALKILKDSGLNIPFILITATVSEDFAVSVLKMGADDYILKDNLSRLPSAIQHAIEKFDNRVSKRKAEEALKSAHNKLVFHLENSPLGYIEWDNRLKVITWSKRAEEIFGWKLEEFNEEQRRGYNHVYIDDQPRLLKIAGQLLNGEIVRNNTEHRAYRKDGSVIWCAWFNSVLQNEDGKVITIMSLVQDITERKKAEETLTKNELRFREFFETAPEALFVIDPVSRNFVDNNDNALKLLKCTRKELLNSSPADYSPEIQPGGRKSIIGIEAMIADALLGNKPVFDWVVLDTKGHEVICEVRLNLLTNTDQPLIRASLLDISERVRLEKKVIEEKITKQVEITEAAINAQEQERAFLGEEMHDNINQILATSKLYLDFSMSAEEIRKDMIMTGRNYVMNAMEEIRKLSKSLIAPSLGEVTLEEAVADMLTNIQLVHKLHFIKEWKNIDEGKLSEKLKLTIFRIIQEQMNNIIKHAKAKKVWIKLLRKRGALQLVLKDDGIGFDTATKRRGVGLKNIASRSSLFKGDIVIISEPGKGCEMQIKFNIEN